MAAGEAADFSVQCARLCAAHKAEDVLLLDLQGITDIADYFVIATVPTRVQMKAIAEATNQEAKARKKGKLGTEGIEVGRWVLIDFGDLIVHLFQPEVRQYYELETLWGDAKRVEWEAKGES